MVKKTSVSAPNPETTNRITLSVKVSADGKAYTTAWEGKTYLASSPLALDRKLDTAKVPLLIDEGEAAMREQLPYLRRLLAEGVHTGSRHVVPSAAP